MCALTLCNDHWLSKWAIIFRLICTIFLFAVRHIIRTFPHSCLIITKLVRKNETEVRINIREEKKSKKKLRVRSSYVNELIGTSCISTTVRKEIALLLHCVHIYSILKVDYRAHSHTARTYTLVIICTIHIYAVLYSSRYIFEFTTYTTHVLTEGDCIGAARLAKKYQLFKQVIR